MTSKSTFSNNDDIVDFYRVPDDVYFRVNMVVSLDGNFAGPSGRSRDLSGPKDLTVLLALRLLSDVVLVGATTAIGEKYRYTQVREDLSNVSKQNPPFCLVSSTLQIPSDAPIFADAKHVPYIITPASKDEVWQQNYARLSQLAQIQVIDVPKLDGRLIRDALHELDFNNILCEGGPKLLETLFASEVVNELDLTISPTIVGSPSPIGALGNSMKRLRLAATATDNDFLFTRYLLADAGQ